MSKVFSRVPALGRKLRGSTLFMERSGVDAGVQGVDPCVWGG